MFDDFPFGTVEDLQAKGILRVEDGNHGNDRPRSEEFGCGNTAFIRAADMQGGRVLFHSAEKINDVAVKRIRKGKGQPGDILFSSKGTVGKLARTGLDAPPFVCSPQTTYWRSLDQRKLDRAFLYFFMRSPWFIEQWEAIKGETDMADYASLTAQRRFKVPLPPMQFQQDVVSVLGPIDDKIELNQQMNRTLEETAAALFRSWFVEFEPVVAKAAGRTPAHLSTTLAALFPDTFQDSELGPVPKGWRVIPVGDVMQIHDSKRIPISGSERAKRPGKFPYYGAASVMDYIDDYIFDGIFLLLGEDGSVVDSDGYPVTQYVWGKIWVNNHAHVLTGTGGVSTEMLLLFFQETMISPYVTGAVQPKLNQQNLKSVPFICPSPAISEQFAKIIEPWFAQLRHNEEESRTLAALRDTLLPKLLSGEVRVKEAEKLVGAKG